MIYERNLWDSNHVLITYSQLFHTRYALHKRAYQHRVSAAVELMLTEVLILANPFLLLPGRLSHLFMSIVYVSTRLMVVRIVMGE